MLRTEIPRQRLREGRSAYVNIEQWRSQSKSFAEMAFFDPVSLTATGGAEAEQISLARVSPNLFPLLGVQPNAECVMPGANAWRVALADNLAHQFVRLRIAQDARDKILVALEPVVDRAQPEAQPLGWTGDRAPRCSLVRASRRAFAYAAAHPALGARSRRVSRARAAVAPPPSRRRRSAPDR